MDNKPQETDSIHIQARLTDTEEKAFWQQFKQTRGLKDAETLRAIINQLRTSQSSPTLKTSLPDGCHRCDLHGVLTTNKKGELIVRCIERIENKQPITKDRTISEAETCSQKPTYIKMPTKERYELEIRLLDAQLDREAENTDELLRKDAYYEGIKTESMQEHADNKTFESRQEILEKELRKAKADLKPMQTYITKNEKLSNWRLHTANYLLRVLKERDTFEMDNDFLTKQVEELSQDRLAEKCASLTVQLSKSGEDIKGLKKEVEAKELVAEKRTLTLNEVISKASSLFGELRQFVPLYAKGYADMIEDFEGYLKTVTPKDSLERFM
ncbi:hypothetical protein MUP77_13580 [Candidatus Bathyarchaeota archaeon]|nr:hypothetical protein [Candidatus Bathyarchaeota archaeon]